MAMCVDPDTQVGIKSTIDLMAEVANETRDVLQKTMQVLIPKEEKDQPLMPRNSGLVGDIESLKVCLQNILDMALTVLRTIGS